MEILKEGGKVLARGMERMRFPSWGYGGAKPAHPMRAVLNMGRPDEKELGKIDELPVKAGDTVTFMSPGGSGYGDPFQREAEAVRRDVETGFVSRQAAATDYGVVVSEQGAVNQAATVRRRAARVKDNIRAAFDFGPEREAWEAVFDDPFRFDVGRSPNPHLGFGFGTHFCLGASLARFELTIVLEEMVARATNLRVVDEVVSSPNMFAWCADSFRLGFDQRA